MKRARVFKFLRLVFALAVFAGAFVTSCGFTFGVEKGVVVNGVNIGGMARSAAVKLLRRQEEEKLKDKALHICAGARVYAFSYPEIGFSDNFYEVVKEAKRGKSYTAEVSYYLNGAKEIADYIAENLSRPVQEPCAIFSATGEPFSYKDGKSGVKADREKLIKDIREALCGDFKEVKVNTEEIAPLKTLEDVKGETSLLYSFTTYFNESNADRSHNIALAARKINGVVLPPDGVFSFNGVVGERTEERGFHKAGIIEDGRFVSGIGGGVCQVSTTLYNAAILSGLQIEECHAHSLSVSYVPLSRDAMVSGNYCDLKFRNTRKTPVYIRAEAGDGAICCRIYGKSDGCGYSFLSEKVRTIPKPEAGEGEIVTLGRDGAESIGYLVTEIGGISHKKLIRRDKYLAVPDVVALPDG